MAPRARDAGFTHYFTGSSPDPETLTDGTPGVAGEATIGAPFTYEAGGRRLEVTSPRGVFSVGHLDRGTAFLLRRGARPDPSASLLLDLGCGWGPVALALAVQAPNAVVWAVDTNPDAVAATARNAERNDLANVRTAVVAAEPALAGLDPDVRFDAVWSNPPIRIGKKDLHALLEATLGRVRPGGHLHLVVQKHLGADSLQRWLTETGHPTKRRAAREGFRLLDVEVTHA